MIATCYHAAWRTDGGRPLHSKPDTLIVVAPAVTIGGVSEVACVVSSAYNRLRHGTVGCWNQARAGIPQWMVGWCTYGGANASADQVYMAVSQEANDQAVSAALLRAECKHARPHRARPTRPIHMHIPPTRETDLIFRVYIYTRNTCRSEYSYPCSYPSSVVVRICVSRTGQYVFSPTAPTHLYISEREADI